MIRPAEYSPITGNRGLDRADRVAARDAAGSDDSMDVTKGEGRYLQLVVSVAIADGGADVITRRPSY